MDLREASTLFGIPLTVLKRMRTEGLLRDSLDENNIRELSFLSHLWGKRWFAGALLRGIRSRRERMLLALFPEYGKIEFYVLNTYLNREEDQAISVASLQHRIKRSFAVDYSELLIRQIRQTAYDIKRGRLKTRAGSADINCSDLLGLTSKLE